MLHHLLSLCHLNTADDGRAEPDKGAAAVCVLPGWHAARSCASCVVASRAAQRAGEEAPHGAPEPRHAAAGPGLAYSCWHKAHLDSRYKKALQGLGDAYDFLFMPAPLHYF